MTKDEAADVKDTAETPAPKKRKHLPPVQVRITKMGNRKVSTGVHLGEEGDETWPAGAIVSLPRDVAEELEVRGLVEIQDDEPVDDKKPEDKKPADDKKPGK